MGRHVLPATAGGDGIGAVRPAMVATELALIAMAVMAQRVLARLTALVSEPFEPIKPI
jgi:hypothetical protein